MSVPAIEIKQLTLSFSKYVALDNINLSIEENSFITIVGPNGAGKSTLLKVILGIITPTIGEVLLYGKPLQSISPKDIGYVPQIKTLDRTFPALPIELVATGIKGSWIGRLNKSEYKKALEALEQVGAKHLERRPLNKLSGGELQRVYLARAVVREPKLLILDEPATGIDYIGETDIYKIIDEYQNTKGATVLMVTHDWDAAYHHADFILLMNRSLICFEKPDKAFSEACLRQTFGHVGHKHDMLFGEHSHD
ncbi:MAG: metal ABC transporter ATP-binding protein [Bacteroidota bacterium]